MRKKNDRGSEEKEQNEAKIIKYWSLLNMGDGHMRCHCSILSTFGEIKTNEILLERFLE